mmetsp:Transcript_60489/g.174519  ORF Transcript_60489/g.174519 Transcript_60489/m.174519 type:complete len:325 (-) Transcript_60489:269-1243(-)
MQRGCRVVDTHNLAENSLDLLDHVVVQIVEVVQRCTESQKEALPLILQLCADLPLKPPDSSVPLRSPSSSTVYGIVLISCCGCPLQLVKSRLRLRASRAEPTQRLCLILGLAAGRLQLLPLHLRLPRVGNTTAGLLRLRGPGAAPPCLDITQQPDQVGLRRRPGGRPIPAASIVHPGEAGHSRGVGHGVPRTRQEAPQCRFRRQPRLVADTPEPLALALHGHAPLVDKMHNVIQKRVHLHASGADPDLAQDTNLGLKVSPQCSQLCSDAELASANVRQHVRGVAVQQIVLKQPSCESVLVCCGQVVCLTAGRQQLALPSDLMPR